MSHFPSAEDYAAEPIRFSPLTVIDVVAEAAAVAGDYRNQVLSRVNTSCLRLAVMTGEYSWHRHPDADGALRSLATLREDRCAAAHMTTAVSVLTGTFAAQPRGRRDTAASVDVIAIAHTDHGSEEVLDMARSARASLSVPGVEGGGKIEAGESGDAKVWLANQAR